jgi:hypothetical protein
MTFLEILVRIIQISDLKLRPQLWYFSGDLLASWFQEWFANEWLVFIYK